MYQQFSQRNGNLGTEHAKPYGREPRHRWPWGSRYLFAFTTAATAAGIVALVNLTLSFPPFVLFSVAVALTWLFAGLGPAAVSLLLCTVASDFLFIEPLYELTFSTSVLGLASAYSAGAVVSRIAVWTWSRDRKGHP
jgi:K+-sensing histidine kinase KdpD